LSFPRRRESHPIKETLAVMWGFFYATNLLWIFFVEIFIILHELNFCILASLKENLFIKKIPFLLIAILALSCCSDSGETDMNALKLVTGITFRQSPDDAPLELGNPNILTNNKFVIYPNPANSSVFIASEENVSDVWIVPAKPDEIYQDVNFSSVLSSGLYSEQTINTNSSIAITGQSSTNSTMNLGTLEKGYYRVFIKIAGVIY
jgi:hypothetical protein